MKKVLKSFLLILSVVTLMPNTVYAGTAQINNHTYVTEDNYYETMDKLVIPSINHIKAEGYIMGNNNMKLHYEKYLVPGAKDSIVIIHGISEAAEKFYEFIYDLTSNNYNVYILEHRGHGNSDRFSDNPSKIDLDKWEYLVEDQKLFVDQIVKPDMKADGKLFLYAHSMGGLVGTTYLEKYPDDYDAAVINCPLYGYEIGIPNVLVNAVTTGLSIIGKGSEYAPGYGDFRTELDLQYALSSSLDRMYYYHEQRVLDEAQHSFSTTNHFVSQTYRMIDYGTKKSNIQKISCPVLLVTGLKDTAVSIKKQDKIASYSENITHMIMPDAMHEIYMENDSILATYIDSILNFYSI